MKTNLKLNYKIAMALGVVILLSLAASARAATYTWRGTNSTAWTTAGNWTNQIVGPTGTSGIGHRLDVNNGPRNELVYDASLGTTVYGLANPGGVRGLAIGSGGGGSGTMTITGGTFITTNNSGGDIIGNNDNNAGILNISGGTFVSGSTTLSLGLGGGTGRSSTMNMNSGSATVGALNFNSLRATLNLVGGTLAVSNLVQTATAGLNTTNNFNGGTLQARASTTSFFPLAANAVVVCNVRNGGAVIDTAGFNITFAQRLRHSIIAGDAAIDGGLTKNGNGMLTLSSTNSYTGSTIVNNGSLVLSGASPYLGSTIVNNGSLTTVGPSIYTNSTIIYAGSLSEPLPLKSSGLIMGSGASFTAALTNSAWAMPAAALTNATIGFNYGSWPVNTYADAVLQVTNLTVSGSVTCNITGTGFPVTNLTLISYQNVGPFPANTFVLGSPLPTGMAANLVDTGSSVVLQITSPAIQSLVWSATYDSNWQTNGQPNWNAGLATYLEYGGGLADIVTFNDTSSGTVSINSQVNPGSTTVNVSSGEYVFSGTGSIGGTNGIAKLGSQKLTIGNSNNFTGPVTISAGTLQVTSAHALGSTNGITIVSGNGSGLSTSGVLALGDGSATGVVVSNETVSIGYSTGNAALAKGGLRGVDAGSNVWAGPLIVAADLARIGTEDNGFLEVSGTITGSSLTNGLVIRPGSGGTVVISGIGNNYAYTRTYCDPTLGGVIRLGANNALATNWLDLGPGILDLNGYNQTVAGVSRTQSGGFGTVKNDGANPSVLTINTDTNNFSSDNNLTDGVNSLSIVKLGSGLQTLNATNLTYTGTTLVSAGRLNLATPNPINTAITVAGGAALSGEITNSSSLTLNANSTLYADIITPGSLTVDSATISGSPVKVVFNFAPDIGTPVLVLTASNGISPANPSDFVAVGLRGGAFGFANGNTELWFTNTAGPTITWKGNDPFNPSFWDVTTTTNWDNAGNPDMFYTGDGVVFNDTASSFNVVVQGASIAPTSMTFNNTANDYTLSGGAIVGTANLIKNGTGRLTITNANSYAGGTAINAGVVDAQTGSALGTNVATVAASAVLDLTAGAVTYNNGLGGAGTVNVALGTTGTLLNKDHSTFNGTLNVGTNGITAAVAGAGAAKVQLNGNLGSAAVVNVLSNATVYISSPSINQAASINLGGGDTGESLGQLRLDGNSTWSGPVTLTGPVTGAGDGNIGAYTGNAGFITGNIGEANGSQTLIKAGSGMITLSGTNTHSGGTTLLAGTLNINQEQALGLAAGTFTINGGTIDNTSGSDITTLDYPIAVGGNFTFAGSYGLNLGTNSISLGSAPRTITVNGSTLTLGGTFTNSAANVGLVKAGAGTLVLKGDNTTFAAGTFGVSITGGTLIASNTAALGAAGQIVSLAGNGTVDLATDTSANAYVLNFPSGGTGTVLVNRATDGVAITHTMGLPTIGNSTFNVQSGGHVTSGTPVLAFPGLSLTAGVAGLGTATLSPTSADIWVNGPVTRPGVSANSLTLDGSSTGNVIAGTISGALNIFKNNSSLWTFSGTNTYTGATTISAGTLKLAATSSIASSAAVTNNDTFDVSAVSGGFTVGSSKILSGYGSVIGAVNVANGGRLIPGSASVGTLTMGSLTLSNGATADFEISNPSYLDQVNVTNNNGLNLIGGGFNLYQPGSSVAFTDDGTYNLIGYSGTLNGSVNNLAVLNAQPGKTYTISAGGGFVQVTIGTAPAASYWTNDIGPDWSWSTMANWTNTLPNAQFETAVFGNPVTFTAPHTVTLDGNKTVGAIIFDSAQSFTIDQGTSGTLQLDNGSGLGIIAETSGSHLINAPVALPALGAALSVTANTTLSLNGAISGSGGITKSGTGTNVLAGSNNYTGSTLVNAGTLVVSNNTALGTTAGATVLNTGTSANAASVVLANGVTVTGETITINGYGQNVRGSLQAGSGATAEWAGPVILGAGATDTRIGAQTNGTLKISGPITDGAIADLHISADGVAGKVIVSGSSTFTGKAGIIRGTLQLGANNSLPASALLDVHSSTGVPDVSIFDLAGYNQTVAGMLRSGNGGGSLVTNSLSLATLTISNTAAYSYPGYLGGAIALVKDGSGTQTLTAATTYTGDTTVKAGTLVISQATLNTNSTITVTNGAVLQLNFAVTNVVAAVVLNGTNQPPGVYNSATAAPYITGTGALEIVSPMANYSTNLTFTVSGSTLELTWPATHLGWYAQSNSVNLADTNFWHDVPGSQSATNLIITVDPAQPNVFYRLSNQSNP